VIHTQIFIAVLQPFLNEMVIILELEAYFVLNEWRSQTYLLDTTETIYPNFIFGQRYFGLHIDAPQRVTFMRKPCHKNSYLLCCQISST
jgi:hypothetical protein